MLMGMRYFCIPGINQLSRLAQGWPVKSTLHEGLVLQQQRFLSPRRGEEKAREAAGKSAYSCTVVLYCEHSFASADSTTVVPYVQYYR